MMKPFKIVFFFVIMTSILIFSVQCDIKQKALGKTNKVVVVADSLLWQDMGADVERVISQREYTPQPEELFTVLQRNADMINRVLRVPNLVILGTLDGDERMVKIIDKFLTKETRARVENGEAFLFAKRDAWAKQQMLAIVVSNTQQELKENLQRDGDKLFNLFDEIEQERTAANFYKYENKALTNNLMKRHGWNVRVQDYFTVVEDSAEANTVILFRDSPSRWFIVTWEDNKTVNDLTEEWILQKRRWLGETWLEGDYLYSDEKHQPELKEIFYLDRPAIEIRALWANETRGGPMRGYGLYDETDGRLYYIDMSVFAPGKRKFPFLRELEAMASTFKTKNNKEVD